MIPALVSSAGRLNGRRFVIIQSPRWTAARRTCFRARLALRFALLPLALIAALCGGPLLHGVALSAETHPSATAASSAPEAAASAPLSGESRRDVGFRLRRAQGQCDSAILDWVLANSGMLKGEMLRGQFRIAYTITPAEGWWEKTVGGKLAWHDAPANQLHLRVFVADASSGKLMPPFSVTATLLDMNDNEQALPVAFGWYPLINAYGGNFAVADGTYRLRVRIAVPEPRDQQPALTAEQIASGQGAASAILADFPSLTIKQSDVASLPIATEAAVAKEAELLKPCNEALSASITALWQQSASGEEKADGNYFVAYALEPASSTGLARLRRRTPLEFGKENTGKENARLDVLVRDSRTGRLIPFLTPQVSVETPGELHDKGTLAPARLPWLDLYDRYLRLERRGNYRLRVTLEPPAFRRWGRHSERFALPAMVEFDEVSLKPEERKAEKARSESGSAR